MSRLVCFGEMLVRLTAPAGEMLLQTPKLSAHIGGAEANVAICVSRLGGEAAMATVLPDNPLGRAARDILTGTSADSHVLRLLPPLILTVEHVQRLATALEELTDNCRTLSDIEVATFHHAPDCLLAEAPSGAHPVFREVVDDRPDYADPAYCPTVWRDTGRGDG